MTRAQFVSSLASGGSLATAGLALGFSTGAGGAAHLPGMVASLTLLPVIAVPVQSKSLNGMDSLLSIALSGWNMGLEFSFLASEGEATRSLRGPGRITCRLTCMQTATTTCAFLCRRKLGHINVSRNSREDVLEELSRIHHSLYQSGNRAANLRRSSIGLHSLQGIWSTPPNT